MRPMAPRVNCFRSSFFFKSVPFSTTLLHNTYTNTNFQSPPHNPKSPTGNHSLNN